MLFGHNTNVSVGDALFHVQTEDRGVAHASIETTVYYRGRLLLKRANEYRDLLPLDGSKEIILKQRLDEQHRLVIEEIRSGALKLAISAAESAGNNPAGATQKPMSGPRLKIRVNNAGGWLKGKKASLHLGVRDELGNPIAQARIVARMEGTTEPLEAHASSGADGSALLEFDMPKFRTADPTLSIEATWGPVRGRLRLQLKPRPRVPAI
jgi:hypothetical protein